MVSSTDPTVLSSCLESWETGSDLRLRRHSTSRQVTRDLVVSRPGRGVGVLLEAAILRAKWGSDSRTPRPRPKRWRHPRLISEHAFDKLRFIDCTFAEFDAALEHAEVIDETDLDPGILKELLLLVEWTRPLHVVAVVDDVRREERVVTVYEPDPEQWSDDYRRRH